MNRRYFIQYSAGAAWVSLMAINACHPAKSVDTAESPGDEGFPLDELSIDELQLAMSEGVYSSRDLVSLYLKRIEAIDRKGIQLNSIIEINPDVLEIADASDRERKSGSVRGLLHGIPFLVKDNIDTGDKMMTTAGSLALVNHRAIADAPVVKQLREAGAVLLGKTNLSEWANFRSTRSSSGWSSRGGQTRNPYSLDRNPCGSSSGSAVAVAANLCAFAIGTETNGSISCPSSINGIVGLKPTVGLVSRTGIIPISKTQDTAGPMTRTVRDAAIILAAINAVDERDEVSLKRSSTPPADYLQYLKEASLEGKRIGVEKSFLKVHEGVDRLLAAAIDQMKEKGATIIEVDFKERLKDIGNNEYQLLQFEFKDGLNRYLADANAGVRSLRELIAFNKANAERVMPFFGQEILEASEAREDLHSEAYRNVLAKVVNISRDAINQVMEENDLQAICGPATGPAWCTDVVNGDAFSGYGMGSGAAMAGYPGITVPLGEVHGLPVGLLFMSKAYEEPALLGIAYAFEQASKNRKPPFFRERVL
jgi:amidase